MAVDDRNELDELEESNGTSFSKAKGTVRRKKATVRKPSSSVRFTVRIDRETYMALQEEAKSKHLPLSVVIRDAIISWVSVRDIELSSRAAALGVAKLLAEKNGTTYQHELQKLLQEATRAMEERYGA